MYIKLTQAPFGEPLKIIKVQDPNLYERLQRMGLFQGGTITLHDEEVQTQPIRVKGPSGERVLGSGMASKVLVHLDDDRRFPIVEMEPGDTGHIEGIMGGTGLARALETMGIHNEDRITFLRKLPPMEYIVLVDNKKRVSLTESMAAKIWGGSGESMRQLVSAPHRADFHVEKFLGGHRVAKMLESKGITPGSTLKLETVKPAQILYMDKENPLVISTDNGLRLFLRQEDGVHIIVDRGQ